MIRLTTTPASPLPIIGHERALIDKLTKSLHNEARRAGPYTGIRDDPRGNHFEVELANGRVARVEITLDRVLPEDERTGDVA